MAGIGSGGMGMGGFLGGHGPLKDGPKGLLGLDFRNRERLKASPAGAGSTIAAGSRPLNRKLVPQPAVIANAAGQRY